MAVKTPQNHNSINPWKDRTSLTRDRTQRNRTELIKLKKLAILRKEQKDL